MRAKKDLARRIVADFHLAEAAAKAGEDWAKQFQKDEVPEDVETVTVKLDEVKGGAISSGNQWQINLDKLLHKAGFAGSVSEAKRKREQGSVRVSGEIRKEIWLGIVCPGPSLDVRVGRTVKLIQVQP